MKKKKNEKTGITRRNFFKFSSGIAAGIPFVGCMPSTETNTSAAKLDSKNAKFVEVPDDTAVRVDSPNEEVRVEVLLQADHVNDSVPHYRIFFRDKPLISASRTAIVLQDGSSLGRSCSIESVKINSSYTPYTMHPGKRSQIIDHFTEAVVTLREHGSSARRWELIIRAYDDGAAFRYQFPSQDGWAQLSLAEEKTEFNLPADAKAFTLPLNSFTESAYEVFYQKKNVTQIPSDWLLGLPMLVECPEAGWLAITEANLTDYAGMYLAAEEQESTTLTSRLSPLPDDSGVAVKADLPHASPWRVVMVGEEPSRLIESDLILNLNAPSVIEDTSWIKPDKTTFPWWNGFHLEDVPFEAGLNTETMKYYINFCSENGIAYHTLDGLNRVAWHGGPTRPYEGADITTAIPEIDMPEVIKYAEEKKVRLRLWLHWESVKEHMEDAFPIYQSWGIEGVMLDFMNRDDQEMVKFLEKVLIKAAECNLTVTLHGASKPTGLERTYPHLLSSEAVRNLEYNKFRNDPIPPEHEVLVAYTRMLAGPLDFHQGSFRGVSLEKFKPQSKAPNVIGTPSRLLASYVVYLNHMPMVADFPSAYRQHPEALSILGEVPATWDDTKVLGGSVEEYIAIARRNGSDWYIGVMGDNNSRTFDLSLDFLKSGSYAAQIYADDPQANDPYRGIIHKTRDVTARKALTVHLEKAGGYLVKLSPQ